jgi:hypothetical protein
MSVAGYLGRAAGELRLAEGDVADYDPVLRAHCRQGGVGSGF